jgi:signal transduction histidine kinase
VATIGQPSGGSRARRPFGVRLYLALTFAAVALLAAGLSYVLSTSSSNEVASDRAAEITLGRTVRLADRIGEHPSSEAEAALTTIMDPGYRAWVFDRRGQLTTPRVQNGMSLGEVPVVRPAVASALRGSGTINELADGVTVVTQPVFRHNDRVGAVLARAERPEEIQEALSGLRGDRLTATLIATGVAMLVGLGIAAALSTRIKRLAESAARMTEGRLDEPLEGTGGRDEITDLGVALETMRIALRETFSALRSERDRLSAILDALDDAVIVVGSDGEVRFSNPASADLIDDDLHVTGAVGSWLQRAEARGIAEHDTLQVGDRVYALSARKLPAEGAVLAVVRDRTDELRREVAEREFVSNAAHELRNPIAGISGAIEVLRAGAKDDPAARDHFLGRLSDDADRVARLTESLLTLARMEAVGEGGTEALDVRIVIEDATQAVAAPDGLDMELDIAPDLVAQGDQVLLRQVLIGLLTNAFKNTPPPGMVTLRARWAGEHEVLIEVSDTGTGIAEAEVDRVFERFYRGSGSLEQEGFGLGLSIAKRMVDVMGGEIGVESELGVGSTFWVRLPAAKPAATPVA